MNGFLSAVETFESLKNVKLSYRPFFGDKFILNKENLDELFKMSDKEILGIIERFFEYTKPTYVIEITLFQNEKTPPLKKVKIELEQLTDKQKKYIKIYREFLKCIQLEQRFDNEFFFNLSKSISLNLKSAKRDLVGDISFKTFGDQIELPKLSTFISKDKSKQVFKSSYSKKAIKLAKNNYQLFDSQFFHNALLQDKQRRTPHLFKIPFLINFDRGLANSNEIAYAPMDLRRITLLRFYYGLIKSRRVHGKDLDYIHLSLGNFVNNSDLGRKPHPEKALMRITDENKKCLEYECVQLGEYGYYSEKQCDPTWQQGEMFESDDVFINSGENLQNYDHFLKMKAEAWQRVNTHKEATRPYEQPYLIPHYRKIFRNLNKVQLDSVQKFLDTNDENLIADYEMLYFYPRCFKLGHYLSRNNKFIYRSGNTAMLCNYDINYTEFNKYAFFEYEPDLDKLGIDEDLNGGVEEKNQEIFEDFLKKLSRKLREIYVKYRERVTKIHPDVSFDRVTLKDMFSNNDQDDEKKKNPYHFIFPQFYIGTNDIKKIEDLTMLTDREIDFLCLNDMGLMDTNQYNLSIGRCLKLHQSAMYYSRPLHFHTTYEYNSEKIRAALNKSILEKLNKPIPYACLSIIVLIKYPTLNLDKIEKKVNANFNELNILKSVDFSLEPDDKVDSYDDMNQNRSNDSYNYSSVKTGQNLGCDLFSRSRKRAGLMRLNQFKLV
jgi:hypothetical protein